MPYKDPAKKKAADSKRRKENPDKAKAIAKAWRAKNKQRIQRYCRKHRKARSAYNAKWCAAHPEYHTAWRAAHPEYHTNWYAANLQRNRRKKSVWRKHKYHSDVNFRITCLLRGRLRDALRGRGVKSAATLELTGCSIDQLVVHLESKFQPGMTWGNCGKWEIDHIRPCASFDLADPVQQRACFNWCNLQPLWALDNRRKGDKLS